MDHSFPLLFVKQVDGLATTFTQDEVPNALFSMDPLKALGPDGFHAYFSKILDCSW